jgi:hypothetical protein
LTVFRLRLSLPFAGIDNLIDIRRMYLICIIGMIALRLVVLRLHQVVAICVSVDIVLGRALLDVLPFLIALLPFLLRQVSAASHALEMRPFSADSPF